MGLLRYLLVRAARVAVLPLRGRLNRFLRDCNNPAKLQERLLLKIIRRQASTGFGRDHGFASIRTIADFRQRVPIAPYERILPYIERLKAGETNALLNDDPLRFFALTSGTTAARKFIPVTDRYLANYRRAWNWWGLRAFQDHRPRDLALRPILQMGGDPEEFRTNGGTPCGNLSGYTGLVQRGMARRQYAVPFECGVMADPLARYYVAARFCLGRPMALFTAANPSTLLALARTLDSQRESLLKDLYDGTLNRDLNLPPELRGPLEARLTANPNEARRLGAIAEKTGNLFPRDAWDPKRFIISTWTGGSMGPYLRLVPKFFGDAPIRDMGLIASEGRFTMPFENFTPSGVLDIASHFFEFVPEAEAESSNPTVLLAHELEWGKNYFLTPTTEAGLYRYQISDLVRVTGFIGQTPKVEFLGKGNRFANLTGEKLSEHQVSQAVHKAQTDTGFALGPFAVAPIWHDVKPYYALFLESPDVAEIETAKRFLVAVERELIKQNSEYEAKRAGGRLDSIRISVAPVGAWSKWDREKIAATGGSPEQYKRPALIGELSFGENFPFEREIVAGG